MTDLHIIPSIERLRQRAVVRALEHEFGRDAIVEALRRAAGVLRAALGERPAATGGPGVADREEAAAFIERHAGTLLRQAGRPSLQPVINATGVIVHTNLGRAPLADAAVRRLGEIGPLYTNLEYDLAGGRRGNRDTHAEALLCRLLAAEAAVVVNNNAAATLLLLAALAAGREVIVSRGELVEIGGGFRVPEVMAQSGAKLREVGTTNRTRVDDYRAAVGPETALLLRVHQSNFRIEGFTERPTVEDLVALGRERGVPVAEDIGSGFVGLPGEPASARLEAALAGEPRVQSSLSAGVDLVCFSGDKLLGGPQAGIIAGRAALVSRIRRHPLMRALRVGKLTYAALEATLGEYAAGRGSRAIPIVRMILASADEIGTRATAVAGRVRVLTAEAGAEPPSGPHAPAVDVIDGASAVGGGSTPGLELPTRLLAVRHARLSAERLDEALRAQEPAIVGRIANDCLVLDLRTVLPEQDEALASAIARLVAESAG